MVRLVLHGPGQPGMGLLLVGVLWLVVLPGGIGLVAHGLLGTPPFVRQNADRSTRGGWSRPVAGFRCGGVHQGASSRR